MLGATSASLKSANSSKCLDIKELPGLSQYAMWNHLILRDLNKNPKTPSFSLYTKENINTYLSNPYTYEKQLRSAVRYIYNASSHFRRLIKYFVSLTDLAYVVTPYKLDPSKANIKRVNSNYRRTLNKLSSMSIKTQFPRILTTVLRDDVGYYTIWETADSITIQELPADYCTISTIEGNVLNVTFDFLYFNTNSDMLDFYPPEFRERYEKYRSGAEGFPRWQELNSPTSFAIKCNTDMLTYAVPPFAGILREVYDLEDFKQLGLSRANIENYALLAMKIGLTDEGNWQLDLKQAEDFWRNLEAVLPSEIGSVLTPMDIEKISFERNKDTQNDDVAQAEQNLFTAAGVSSLLFNNPKSSANALMLSIKADQAITYELVLSLQDAVNRYIQSFGFGKNFKVVFLDVSPFNRKEAGDQYLKACQYGVPMVSYYCASQGLDQAELDSMNYLENEVLNIKKDFIPLQSSSTQSASGGDVGAPEKAAEEISDSTEENQETFDSNGIW